MNGADENLAGDGAAELLEGGLASEVAPEIDHQVQPQQGEDGEIGEGQPPANRHQNVKEICVRRALMASSSRRMFRLYSSLKAANSLRSKRMPVTGPCSSPMSPNNGSAFGTFMYS